MEPDVDSRTRADAGTTKLSLFSRVSPDLRVGMERQPDEGDRLGSSEARRGLCLGCGKKHIVTSRQRGVACIWIALIVATCAFARRGINGTRPVDTR